MAATPRRRRLAMVLSTVACVLLFGSTVADAYAGKSPPLFQWGLALMFFVGAVDAWLRWRQGPQEANLAMEGHLRVLAVTGGIAASALTLWSIGVDVQQGRQVPLVDGLMLALFVLMTVGAWRQWSGRWP